MRRSSIDRGSSLRFAALLGILLSPEGAWAEPVRRLGVTPLSAPVVVDGDLGEWSALGSAAAEPIPLQLSETLEEEETPPPGEEKPPALEIQLGIHGRRLYVGARWADPTPSQEYKPWRRQGGRFQQQRLVDDMFVLRFQTGESFSSCMLANRPYVTDLWRWSAGRSDLTGIADDMIHRFSDKPFDQPSVEYEGLRGMVYFLKAMDSGTGGWQMTARPEGSQGGVVPGTETRVPPQGSRADVVAKGSWRDGYWSLEMGRDFSTGDPEDVLFEPGKGIVFQGGVFLAGYKMKKYITPSLEFGLPGP
ncbi:MAG: hypothetical protein HQL57_05425 [Magnetococcales bacterium]|nr:hypothetical protein [Magnetococcales bacterium]MBF0156606.1 hypothetical protein [Magnetococcales bacterium]